MNTIVYLTSKGRGDIEPSMRVLDELQEARDLGAETIHVEYDKQVRDEMGWELPCPAFDCLSEQHNTVMDTFNPDRMVWVHPDCVLPHGWFKALMDCMDEVPSCGYASPFNWPNPTKAQFMGEEYDDSYWRCRRTEVIDAEEIAAFAEAHRNDYQLGGCVPFCITREAYEAVGPWDPKFMLLAGFEDLDMQWRLMKAGIDVLTFCRSVVWHRGLGGSSANCRAAAMVAANRRVFQYKHKVLFSENLGPFPPEFKPPTISGWRLYSE